MSYILIKHKSILVFIIFTIALVALLMPSSVLPDIRSRLFYHLWQSGHFLVFFLGSYLFYNLYPKFSHLDVGWQVVFLLIVAAICALAVEGLQAFLSGKTLELSDIIGDMAGVLLFLSLRTLHNGKMACLHGMTLVLIGFVMWPVLSSFIDVMLIRYQFPLLADFETPFEASRFEGRTGAASITDEQSFHGRHSLKLSCFPGPWSGMMLQHFSSDWRGYSQLHIAVYNPNPQPVSFHIRIHDVVHEQGEKAYNDLYSEIISLQTGTWTQVEIPLVKIENAPAGRQMDLEHIRGLGLFVVKEDKPLVLYIDTIMLEYKVLGKK